MAKYYQQCLILISLILFQTALCAQDNADDSHNLPVFMHVEKEVLDRHDESRQFSLNFDITFLKATQLHHSIRVTPEAHSSFAARKGEILHSYKQQVQDGHVDKKQLHVLYDPSRVSNSVQQLSLDFTDDETGRILNSLMIMVYFTPWNTIEIWD